MARLDNLEQDRTAEAEIEYRSAAEDFDIAADTVVDIAPEFFEALPKMAADRSENFLALRR